MRAAALVLLVLLAGCSFLAPKEAGGGGGGEAVSAIAEILPSPFGAIVGAAGSLMTLAGGLWVAKAGRRAAALRAVTAGVQAAGDAAVKSAIQARARAAGPAVSAELESHVAALEPPKP